MNKIKQVFTLFAFMTGISLFWLGYFGVFGWVNEVDITKISFIILALFLVAFASLYHEAKSDKPLKNKFELQMYLANNLTSLGLLGTVIGLMIAVNAISGLNIDVSDQSTVISLMQSMFNALGTSLVTTIIGLICSLVLKLQIVALQVVATNETKQILRG